MRIGLAAYDVPASDVRELARAADEVGIHILFLGEHLLLQRDYASRHPSTAGQAIQYHTGPLVDESTALVDPMVTLAAASSVTSRIRLATGIYLLPLRSPLVTAREAATLAELSRGRFALGAGSGWLREEFDALDVPFSGRGARMDEAVAVLRLAWRGGPFSFHGSCFEYDDIQVTPVPVTVPLIVGGNSARALRRAATSGDGWFSSGSPTLDEAIALRERLLILRVDSGADGPFEIFVRSREATPQCIDAYQDAGFEHLVLWADEFWPRTGTVTEKREIFLTRTEALHVADRARA